MVAYCCVKGCKSHSDHKKKDPDAMISFHAFPSNLEIRQKWLKAIGRPDWSPPNYSRVCSTHFSYEQLNLDGQRIRIKDNAVPSKDLPANSNFEASQVQVCRFCLAAGVKLHSLQDGVHRVRLDSLTAYNENYNIEGLPQFICYECAPHLRKCYILLQRSFTVQATLLDIFAQYGEISIDLIKTKNRKELNLSSPLSKQKITSENIEYNFKNADGADRSIIPKEKSTNSAMQPKHIQCTEKCEDLNEEEKEDTMDFNDRDYKEDWLHDGAINSAHSSSDNELELEHKNLGDKECEEKVEGLTPDEVKMQKYFKIVRLTLDQQIEEWKSKGKEQMTGESFTCETCSRVFANQNSYLLHTQTHDPSRGSAECAVCRARFKTATLARSHANRTHAKRFYCNQCPNIYGNVAGAKRHVARHWGHVYGCGRCAFRSAHASALGAHARRAHGAAACARCGRAFRGKRGLLLHHRAAHPAHAESENSAQYSCSQCELVFSSEGARRVHLLTSKQHKQKTSLCDATPQDPSLKNACTKCGEQFPSLKQLIQHSREQHGRPKRKTSWRLPGDCYPTKCEHCGVVVGSRGEHWRHVRRAHPAQRAAYRAVVTAVCDTCGHGCQNSTKLEMHKLRHGPPTVPCALCPRLFYDKYALARHRATHADARPHRCARCGLAFKQRGNLERHSRVHTGITPYECSLCGKKFKYSSSMNLHIRTVHYKLPHPPRKRKNKKDENEAL